MIRIGSGRMGEIASTGVNTVVDDVAWQFRPRQENPALVDLINIQTVTENTVETRKSHLIFLAHSLMQVFIVTFKVKIGFNGREALVVSCSSMK